MQSGEWKLHCWLQLNLIFVIFCTNDALFIFSFPCTKGKIVFSCWTEQFEVVYLGSFWELFTWRPNMRNLYKFCVHPQNGTVTMSLQIIHIKKLWKKPTNSTQAEFITGIEKKPHNLEKKHFCKTATFSLEVLKIKKENFNILFLRKKKIQY